MCMHFLTLVLGSGFLVFLASLTICLLALIRFLVSSEIYKFMSLILLLGHESSNADCITLARYSHVSSSGELTSKRGRYLLIRWLNLDQSIFFQI